MILHQIGLAVPLLPPFKIFSYCLCWYYSLNTNSVFEHHAKNIMPRGEPGLMVHWSLNIFEVKEEARSQSFCLLVCSEWILTSWPYGNCSTITLTWPGPLKYNLRKCLQALAKMPWKKKVIFVSSPLLNLHIFLFCFLSYLLSWHPLLRLTSAMG